MTDLTKPVQTRDGQAVRILAADIKNEESVVAVVTDFYGYQTVEMYYSDGRYLGPGEPDDDLDHVNVPVIHIVYINIYGVWLASRGPILDLSPEFDTLEEALDAGQRSPAGYLTTLRLEVKE